MGEPAFRAKQVWQAVYVDSGRRPARNHHTFANHCAKNLTEAFTFNSPHPNPQIDLIRQPNHQNAFSTAGCKGHRSRVDALRRTPYPVHFLPGRLRHGLRFLRHRSNGLQTQPFRGEIVEQVLYYARLLQTESKVVTNIVVMGMGEPFHNYDAVLAAIDRLNDPTGFNLGARRFTISTVGLVPKIERFAAEKRQVNLAISLHAANDELRSSLLPVNHKVSLLLI